jgi:ketosteroid isomerase-like protein
MRLGAAHRGTLCCEPSKRMKINDMNIVRRLPFALLPGLASALTVAAPAPDVRDADVAFAARAAEVGHHAAFVEYLAEDAVLFRPEPVAGQEWLATHEPAGGQLEWQPAAAAASCNRQLAVTSGPWRYSNAAGGDPVAGHYLSVWQLQADGQWRVVLDHGIDHDPAAVPAEALDSAFARLWPVAKSGKCAGRGEARDLDDAEQAFNHRVRREGLPRALSESAAAGMIAYRDDAAPGRITATWPAEDARFAAGTVAQTAGTVFAPDADVAATYGVLQSAEGGKRSLYVRVWSRERRRWRVAVDLQAPLPPVSPLLRSP